MVLKKEEIRQYVQDVLDVLKNKLESMDLSINSLHEALRGVTTTPLAFFILFLLVKIGVLRVTKEEKYPFHNKQHQKYFSEIYYFYIKLVDPWRSNIRERNAAYKYLIDVLTEAIMQDSLVRA